MRSINAALLALVMTACQNPGAEEPATTDTAREKTTAEKAFDAGQNARKKAEQIKADQDKKARETDEAADP